MRYLALLPILLAGSAPAGAGPIPPDDERFFEASIRPVLVSHCQRCHGPAKQMGGLRLDSREALVKGGSRGASLAASDPAKSLLVKAVRHEGALKMPPAEKLSDRQVADLTRWVRLGAPWPSQSAVRNPQSAVGHWAFQPVRRPTVPPVKDRSWVRTPVDAFILARLESKGLKPAPPADRRTLIRRATFDLTGLPPTPAEIDAFLADKSADAYEKVVERLLASPQYGERWGRHWLDVARYSDSNGMDENVHYGNAWRYRDYVVDSFNRDKPYDRFVLEQIAGDLLAPPQDLRDRQALLIATGFFSIGPKVISEVDDRKMEMDTIDEEVDTLGRTFMGMTLGCARCHDHKFDPISTKDYYALAGIFKSTKTMSVMKKPRMWYEHSLATPEDLARQSAHQKLIDANKAAVEATLAAARTKAGLKPGAKVAEATLPAEAQAELKRLRAEQAELEKQAPEPPAAMGVTEAETCDLPVHIRGSFLDLGEMVPRRFPVVLAGQTQPQLPEKQSGRLELGRWLVSPDHPLTSRVMANRIWHWHFGQGIVRTTDNFGRLGEPPSHPELLDWLASTFAADRGTEGKRDRGTEGQRGTVDRWSVKGMHRLMMLSSAYRMSATGDPQTVKADPENRFFGRWEMRRLSAEELRDSLLAVSGTLGLTMGGSILPLKNREYIFDHTSKDNTRYDSRRRSLYLPVIRNHLYDVFQLFDFGDAQVPDGNRTTSTVAPQALFLMNSDLVQDAAGALADVILAYSGLDATGRTRAVYLRAYGRPPSEKETSRDRDLLARFEAAQPSDTPAAQRQRQAWAWLCQSVMAANEFVYVR